MIFNCDVYDFNDSLYVRRGNGDLPDFSDSPDEERGVFENIFMFWKEKI